MAGPGQDLHYPPSSQTVDLYEEIDEIQEELRGLQLNNRINNSNHENISNKIRGIRSHFAYLEHVAILTGDSVRLEPMFHDIELLIRNCLNEIRR